MSLLVNADTLTASRNWDFRLAKNGAASFLCEMYNGNTLESAGISAIFNRIQYIDMGHWKAAKEKERNYAEQEFYAFFLGWLLSFKGKITNLPSPLNISGTYFQPFVWRMLAAKEGIAVKDYDSTPEPEADKDRIINRPRQKVYITGDVISGYLPGMPAVARLLKLSQSVQCNFLEMQFEKINKHWHFDTADSFPAEFHTSAKCMEFLYRYFDHAIKESNGVNMWHTQRTAS